MPLDAPHGTGLAAADPLAAAPPDAPRVTIALVVRDRPGLLLRTLNSIAALPAGIEFEVVVVDDGSDGSAAEVLAACSGDIVTLRNERSRGYGPACDQAAARARGDVLMLLREDCVPVEGWLAPLVEAVERDPAIGAARPTSATAAGSFVGPETWICLAVRRAAYEAVGGFAGSSEPGRFDKASLLHALGREGWRVVDEPAALALAVPALPAQ